MKRRAETERAAAGRQLAWAALLLVSACSDGESATKQETPVDSSAASSNVGADASQGQTQRAAGDSTTSEVDAALRADPRLAHLLAPCAKWDHYDVDTADVGPILVEMLLRGDRDALRRGRDELAARGADGIALVSRVVDRFLQDGDGFAPLRNAVDVCQRSDSPAARAVLLRLLNGSFEGVAVQAVQALGKHGEPEDLDAVLGVFERAGLENKMKVALAMHEIDPVRVSLLYLDWIENGFASSHWDLMCQAIANSHDAVVAWRARELREKVPERFHAHLSAPAARAGDPDALQFLREQLRAPETWRRELAISAFVAAGRPDELADTALNDPNGEVRMRAIAALNPSSPAAREVLRAGALSPDMQIASTCLGILIRQGDDLAIDRTLQMLVDGAPENLGVAMSALEPAFVDRNVSERALELLSRRAKLEGAPLAERVTVLESIARIPLDESARLLRDQASRETGELKGLPARRWLLRLVGNLGECGQRLAAAELKDCTDPALRLDLLEAISLRATKFAHDEMLRLAEGGDLSALELLFVADRLTLLASVEDSVGLLKRATLRIEDAQVRRAMQCLMWRCFPGPR